MPTLSTCDPPLLEQTKARLRAFYALDLYLPGSRFARAVRHFQRMQTAARSCRLLQRAAWHELLTRRPIRLIEVKKCDGNVNLSELAILAQAATEVPIGREIIEIGTFDGRTTINLAINAAAGVPLFTIDLPADRATAFALESSERRYVDKLAPGARLRSAGPAWQAYAGRIVQLLGDSAAFDWSAHSGKAGLVFVDGSHAYENVRRDTETALRLAAKGGMVFWHDYGVWPGVTRVLEELAEGPRLALTHIQGTSLVYFRKASSCPRTPR